MTQHKQPTEPVVVPKALCGKWIVWNRNRTQIVGSGDRLKDAQEVARAAGIADPGYEWVPPANRRLIGRPT